jgi:uncharacterized RDD family membrane protein YckC
VTVDEAPSEGRRPRRRSTPAPAADDAALGLFVASARLARAATRLLTYAPGVNPLLQRSAATGRAAREAGMERIESAAQSALAAPEVGRLVDGALASPLPEKVARASVAHHVGDRVAAELEPERARWLEQVLDSPEFEQALERALASPKVREAIAKQATSLADEVGAHLRARVITVDQRFARPSPRFAGLPARTVAFGVDLILAQLIFIAVTAVVGLVVELVGDLRPAWLFGALAGAGWTLLVGGYFVFFWTLGGQTPGMRMLHLRVAGPAGSGVGVGRGLLRFVTLLVAIVPAFLGLAPILFDERRRGLHDFVAGTTVMYSP